MENDKKQGFTEPEFEVWKSLVSTHNKFVELPDMHPSDKLEWSNAMHRLQDLMAFRLAKRNFPIYFST